MLSRILWISVAGIALIVGMAVQDGDSIFGWGDHKGDSRHKEQAIEARVERAIEGSFDKVRVEGSDGREIDVPAETKRAMANAVGRLVKAETKLAMARVGDDDEEAIRAASAERDRARTEIDRLKAEIKKYERAGKSDNDALREQIRREVQEDIRATVRDSVRS